MVVAVVDTVVALEWRELWTRRNKEVTILQWLDRGGRYVLHVRQYLTRTLEEMVKMTTSREECDSRVCPDPEVPRKRDSDTAIGRGGSRKRRIWI